MRTSKHSLLRLIAGSALVVPLFVGSIACASSATVGGSEVTDVTGDPVRAKIMIINESTNRAVLTVSGTEVANILPSQRICIELPARIDNQDLRLEGTSFTIIRKSWSTEPYWQVTIPDSDDFTVRLTALPGAAC